jgi:hypothetical protein
LELWVSIIIENIKYLFVAIYYTDTEQYNQTISSVFSSAAVGLSFMQFTNMNSMRNLFIIGVSLFLGLSIPEYFSRYSTSSQQGPAHTKAGWVCNFSYCTFHI